MKKTQPLSTMPEPVKPVTPITVAAPPQPMATESVESPIPMALCWALFSVSAIVLIVQIWNYFS